MYAEDIGSIKDCAVELKEMFGTPESRENMEKLGVICKDNDDCETIKNCYEECFGEIPPAMTGSEKKY